MYRRLARTVVASCLALLALVLVIPFAKSRDAQDLIAPTVLAALAAWFRWGGNKQ